MYKTTVEGDLALESGYYLNISNNKYHTPISVHYLTKEIIFA